MAPLNPPMHIGNTTFMLNLERYKHTEVQLSQENASEMWKCSYEMLVETSEKSSGQ